MVQKHGAEHTAWLYGLCQKYQLKDAEKPEVMPPCHLRFPKIPDQAGYVKYTTNVTYPYVSQIALALEARAELAIQFPSESQLNYSGHVYK